MDRKDLLERLRRGHHENVGFADFCRLVEACGFRLLRIEGSHRAYKHPSVPRILNLQPRRGQAKGYQVRQFVDFVEQYNLSMESDR
ncbi:MAG TPA: type II toxin-antitoxin system HicA family toxin [Thermoanaerobaculia bacterium]